MKAYQLLRKTEFDQGKVLYQSQSLFSVMEKKRNYEAAVELADRCRNCPARVYINNEEEISAEELKERFSNRACLNAVLSRENEDKLFSGDNKNVDVVKGFYECSQRETNLSIYDELACDPNLAIEFYIATIGSDTKNTKGG